MSLLESYIDPVTTRELLNNLNLAIDEAEVMETLDVLTDRVQNIESSRGVNNRSESLRKEIKKLEVQINYLRDKATLC